MAKTQALDQSEPIEGLSIVSFTKGLRLIPSQSEAFFLVGGPACPSYARLARWRDARSSLLHLRQQNKLFEPPTNHCRLRHGNRHGFSWLSDPLALRHSVGTVDVLDIAFLGRPARRASTLKPICFLITVVVFAAGILVGWMDTHGRKPPEFLSSLVDEVRNRLDKPEDPPKPGEPESERKNSDQTSGEHPPESPQGEGTETGPTGDPSPEDEEKLEEIVALLEAQDFSRAAREASDLAQRSRGHVKRRALQLEAKALVFSKLLPARSEPPGVSKVVLSNQDSVVALEVVEEEQRYRIKRASGTMFFPARKEVVRIESVDLKSFLEEQRKRMEPRIAELKHPIDVYIRGIRKLYQIGLPDDGYRLMEKLLELPDSHYVPLAFGGEDAERLLALWRAAAGEIEVPEEPTAVASAKKHVETPKEVVQRRPPPVPLPGDTTSPEIGAARELIREAVILYRDAQGKEGRQDDIRTAYAKLLEAQTLLEPFAADESARGLMRELAQMIVDVGKAMPFY